MYYSMRSATCVTETTRNVNLCGARGNDETLHRDCRWNYCSSCLSLSLYKEIKYVSSQKWTVHKVLVLKYTHCTSKTYWVWFLYLGVFSNPVDDILIGSLTYVGNIFILSNVAIQSLVKRTECRRSTFSLDASRMNFKFLKCEYVQAGYWRLFFIKGWRIIFFHDDAPWRITTYRTMSTDRPFYKYTQKLSQIANFRWDCLCRRCTCDLSTDLMSAKMIRY
jgi:hypothetical protein